MGRGARGVKRVLEIIREKYVVAVEKYIFKTYFKKSQILHYLNVVDCVYDTIKLRRPHWLQKWSLYMAIVTKLRGTNALQSTRISNYITTTPHYG